jgi:hypothetical protein
MNKTLSNGLHHDHVDGVLKSFFRGEMPAPWPEAKVPPPARPLPRQRTWMQSYGRLALVASVTLILLSYLTLAAMFPAESGSGLPVDRHETIASKPGILKHRVPTPRGGEALLWEETIPGDRPTIIITVEQIKGPQKR